MKKKQNDFDDDEIILDIVTEALREAYIDTDERLIVWPDGKRLTVDQSAERINKKNDFDIEVMKDCIMAWVEMDAQPQNMNRKKEDILEKDLRNWVNDYYEEKQNSSILETDK